MDYTSNITLLDRNQASPPGKVSVHYSGYQPDDIPNNVYAKYDEISDTLTIEFDYGNSSESKIPVRGSSGHMSSLFGRVSFRPYKIIVTELDNTSKLKKSIASIIEALKEKVHSSEKRKTRNIRMANSLIAQSIRLFRNHIKTNRWE